MKRFVRTRQRPSGFRVILATRISGLGPGNWVVTIGQDLFGGQSGDARVRPVNWQWVEELQNLQREDLLEELVKKQQEAGKDSTAL